MVNALLERSEVLSDDIKTAKPSFLSNVGIGKLLKSVLSKAEDHLTEAYTQRLKNHVADYNWPADLVDKIKIAYNNGAHQIAYPKELEDQILTIEYGTPSVPPSPALRTFSIGIGR